MPRYQPILSDNELARQAEQMLANSQDMERALRESIRLILSLNNGAIQGEFADAITGFAREMESMLAEEFTASAREVQQGIKQLNASVPPADDSRELS